MRRITLAIIISSILSSPFTSAHATGVSKKPALTARDAAFGMTLTRYPRTPIGKAVSNTVVRHPNATALVPSAPKKSYAQGTFSENNGDDTAYDLQLKLKVRNPIQ